MGESGSIRRREKKEDGEPGKVTSRKPNKRKNRKSCPLGQMLPSSKEEDSGRPVRGKSLDTMHGQTDSL